MRSLSDLKARLGKGRRCFAFFHPCLPGEPLVFVHVALLPEVAGSMAEIVNLGGDSGSAGDRGQTGDGFEEHEVVWVMEEDELEAEENRGDKVLRGQQF